MQKNKKSTEMQKRYESLLHFSFARCIIKEKRMSGSEKRMKESLETTVRRLKEDTTTTEMLRLVSMASVVISAYAVGYLLVSLLPKDPWEALKIAVLLFVPLVLVSLVRVLVKAPRPFELYGIEPPKGRHTKGRSFPSRHAHCAFAIATLTLFYQPVFGALLLAVAVFAAIARVLLGLHFPRDVVAGGVTGIVSSLLGVCILLFL